MTCKTLVGADRLNWNGMTKVQWLYPPRPDWLKHVSGCGHNPHDQGNSDDSNDRNWAIENKDSDSRWHFKEALVRACLRHKIATVQVVKRTRISSWWLVEWGGGADTDINFKPIWRSTTAVTRVVANSIIWDILTRNLIIHWSLFRKYNRTWNTDNFIVSFEHLWTSYSFSKKVLFSNEIWNKWEWAIFSQQKRLSFYERKLLESLNILVDGCLTTSMPFRQRITEVISKQYALHSINARERYNFVKPTANLSSVTKSVP